MAFDALTGWQTGYEVNSGNEAADGDTTASGGTFSTKDAQHMAALLQEIVDALDYIANN